MARQFKRVTTKQLVEACQSGDSIGFCIGCGAEVYGVEPDACKYTCEVCGQPKVYGAEELLMYIA